MKPGSMSGFCTAALALGFGISSVASSPRVYAQSTVYNTSLGETILAGEAEQANEPTDGRLPHKDKGTRVIVFANNPNDARKVAEEIAKKAYWNSSHFGGTAEELKANGLWQQKKSK